MTCPSQEHRAPRTAGLSGQLLQPTRGRGCSVAPNASAVLLQQHSLLMETQDRAGFRKGQSASFSGQCRKSQASSPASAHCILSTPAQVVLMQPGPELLWACYSQLPWLGRQGSEAGQPLLPQRQKGRSDLPSFSTTASPASSSTFSSHLLYCGSGRQPVLQASSHSASA